MDNYDHPPEITTLFDGAQENPNSYLYREAIHHALKKILPKHFSASSVGDPDLLEDRRNEFFASLPLLVSTPCDAAPANISFYVLAKFRPHSFKFFFEMLSHWLIPGKRLNVVTAFTVNFQLPSFGEETLTLCDVMIHVDNQAEVEEIARTFPIIETELRLGMQSNYYARRVLEIKGLSADAKTATIQEDMAYLISRLPKEFDHDLLTEMQHVLVICRDEFKAARGCRHLSRIISVHYLFRKGLLEAVKKDPEKRHLSLKLFQTSIHEPEGNKAVLGVLVGINFLRDTEVFEERHLLNAIQNYIPSAHAVEGSFFSNKRGHENLCTLYLEIEKTGGEPFSINEIRFLRRSLPSDLKDRIEHLLHPIFMPRNEEEVLRNILTLSSQIKYLHDLPQVIISFDKQTHLSLCFTVISVAAMKAGDLSIQERFKDSNSFLTYMHDRSKAVGALRKKYTKEATVFNVKLAKNQFLRRDHSLDLNKARQIVVGELTRILGEFRDFNGGMISKQHEFLCEVRELLQDDTKYNELLLENFFYSLTPDVMRTVVTPQALKTLFLMLLESIQNGFFNEEKYVLKIQKDPQHVYAMIKTEDRLIGDTIGQALAAFDSSSAAMASSVVLVYDISYLGYLYLCNDPVKQEEFCQIIEAQLAPYIAI